MPSQMNLSLPTSPLRVATTSFASIKDAVVTMYLFNKSDIKTIVFPITIFAQALAQSSHSWTRFIMVLTWVWFELLEFTISNQSFGDSPAEDAVNKPERPIPSKRLTLDQAKLLRGLITPANLMLGYTLGTLPASFGISIFTPIHNEGGAHNYWLTKNGCTAILYALFEYGAVRIADAKQDLCQNQWLAILGSCLIILSTVHAQDFRDMEGDASQGRKTFPLVCPRLAPWSMLTLPLMWSIALCIVSQVHVIFLLSLLFVAALIGYRFTFLTTPEDHRKSYLYYNIFLCLSHIALSRVSLDTPAIQWAQNLYH